MLHISNIGESVCNSYNHSAIMNVGKEHGHNFVTRGNKDYYSVHQQLQVYRQWMSMQQIYCGV